MEKTPQYLLPSYNPATHTIPELSSILSSHNVPLPPTRARKSVYVDLFNSHIAGKRAQILKGLRAVVPSGEGIVLVGDHDKLKKAGKKVTGEVGGENAKEGSRTAVPVLRRKRKKGVCFECLVWFLLCVFEMTN